MRFPDCRILIFAKAPLVGRVKTRLFGALSPAHSASLHARMLVWVLQRTVEAELAPVELFCTPDGGHPLFIELAARYPIRRRVQGQGDLGERMALAARSALVDCRRVVLIGTDCPLLDGDYLGQLFARLGGDCSVVIGPAEDGGYVALGLSRYDRRVFEGIEWGTDQVLAQTRRRLDELGWGYALMPPLWDVDRPPDLERLRRTLPELLSDQSELDLDWLQALASE